MLSPKIKKAIIWVRLFELYTKITVPIIERISPNKWLKPENESFIFIYYMLHYFWWYVMFEALFYKKTARNIKQLIEFFDYAPKMRVIISSRCPWGSTYENYNYIVANKNYDHLSGRDEFAIKESAKAVRLRVVQDMGVETFFDIELNECFKKNVDMYLDFFEDKVIADSLIVGQVAAMLYLEGYPKEEIKQMLLLDASEIKKKYM